MVPIAALWLPILISAVIVFLVSSLIHMVIGWHRADFRKAPSEGELMEAMRRFDLKPGDYMIPRAEGMADMKKPEFIERRTKGPVAILTVLPSGPPTMGRALLQWFLYSIVVGVFAAYIAGRALAPGVHYLQVFRFAGCTAFVAYAVAGWQNSIWYGRSWGTTARNTLDALIYALMTGGTFGWLWPR